MNRTLNISFVKRDRPAMTGRPVGWVYDRVNTRRKDGGSKMRRRSIEVRGEKFTPTKNLSPIFSSRRAAKAEFAAVIRDSSTGVLAKITDSSKDTVKCWRARRSFPGGENLMQLAAEGGDEAVREWVALKCGFISPEMAEAAYASAYQVEHQNNPDAEAVRESVRRAGRRRNALYATIMAARQGLPERDGGE